jgi:hypothetical protein
MYISVYKELHIIKCRYVYYPTNIFYREVHLILLSRCYYVISTSRPCSFSFSRQALLSAGGSGS